VQYVCNYLSICCMNQVLRFLLGSPQRVITTGIMGFVVWGMVNPRSVSLLIALCWNNFWEAFGPLFQILLQLFIVCGVIWLFVKSLFKKTK
jgi:hypothetical protein